MIHFLFVLAAVLALCVFRRKKLFSGSLDIGHDHSFCKVNKHVWLPRFCKYDPRSKDTWTPNYEAVQYVHGHNFENKRFFLYSEGKLHHTRCSYILSPHLVFLSFLFNEFLTDVHIIAFGAAAAGLISVFADPNSVFFTPALLLCTPFFGAAWGLDHAIRTATPENRTHSLDISGSPKLQKRFVKPSYFFFSIGSLMSELSILLLTVQTVCCFYRGSGPLRAVNLLGTAALLAVSLYTYASTTREVFESSWRGDRITYTISRRKVSPKRLGDLYILCAEMALLTIAILIANASAPQVIHFAVAPAFLFPCIAVLTLLVAAVSRHIINTYTPPKAKEQKYFAKRSYCKNNEVFHDCTFVEPSEAAGCELYYMPHDEYQRFKKEEEKKRIEQEKYEKELAQLMEYEAKSTGLKKLRWQYRIGELKDERFKYTNEAWELRVKISKLEQKVQEEHDAKRREKSYWEYMRWWDEHATEWLGGKRVTPEELDRFLRLSGLGKYAENPDAPPEIAQKEKEGGYVNDIDTNNATDRFNQRR